jgi:hypothetical protein
MRRRRWALAQCPRLFVQLEPRSLELLDHPLGELAPGIIWGVFSKEPAEQVTAPRQGEADREHELSAEGVVIHQICSCYVLRGQVITQTAGAVKYDALT